MYIFPNPIEIELGNLVLRVRGAESANGNIVARADIVDPQDQMLFTDDVRLNNATRRRAYIDEASRRSAAIDMSILENQLIQLNTNVENYLQQVQDPGAADRSSVRQSGPRPVDRMIALAEDSAIELFHTPERRPVATVANDANVRTMLIRSGDFETFLSGLYYRETRQALGVNALSEAVGILAARALEDGTEHPVYTRVASHNNNVFIDLANNQGQVLEITPEGWRIVSEPPVRFLRNRHMQSLPEPTRGGSLELLRNHLNVSRETDWIVMAAWLVAAMYPKGPYPILVLSGEQGSAKSTTGRMLVSLVDPRSAPLRTLPRTELDLLIAARNGQVFGYDNLSQIRPWLSDAFCRLSTGGGFSTRALYTDSDETVIDVMRPILLTSIVDVVEREDLIDRSLMIHLPQIPGGQRQTEAEVWDAFRNDQPRILGALCDALSSALRHWDSVDLGNLPRMADFSRLIQAAEAALPWESGSFQRAYDANQQEAVEIAIDGTPVACAVREFARNLDSPWVGTATDLLQTLNRSQGRIAEVREHAGRQWPRTTNWLSGKLRRATPSLRRVGVEIEFTRGSQRRIAICRMQ